MLKHLYLLKSGTVLGIMWDAAEFVIVPTTQKKEIKTEYSPFSNFRYFHVRRPSINSYQCLLSFREIIHLSPDAENGIKFRLETYKNYYVLHTNYDYGGELVSYYNIRTKYLEYEEYISNTEHIIFKKSNKL